MNPSHLVDCISLGTLYVVVVSAQLEELVLDRADLGICDPDGVGWRVSSSSRPVNQRAGAPLPESWRLRRSSSTFASLSPNCMAEGERGVPAYETQKRE